MKSRMYLYLFVFAALIALYLFVSGDKMVKQKDIKIEKLRSEIISLKDSVQKSQLKILDMQYFS